MLKILAFNQGQVIESSSMARDIRLSSHTVNSYLDILSATFILEPLSSFHKNLNTELKKSKKYYLYDLGIRNLLVQNFSKLSQREDKGSIYETYVFNYLHSRLLPNMSLKFWRTKQKQEIDFILSKNQSLYPVEVKSNLKRAEIPAALFKFKDSYPEMTDAFIINENLDLSVNTGEFTVHFLPISELENFQLLEDILDSVR